MNHKDSLTHSQKNALSQLVEKAGRHWEARRQAAAAQRNLTPRTSPVFTIALAREAGTQGTAVAQEVGRLLGWHVYDHELLEQIAQDMGLRTSLLESVDERQQSWLVDSIEGLLSAPAKSEWEPLVSEPAYVHHLVQTVLALGVHGECVIVGRGAAFILPAATTVRVRLVARVQHRIAVLQRTLGLSAQEAARQVRTLDRERSDFIQDHFQKNPGDPHHYDLILNSSRLSIANSAQVIVEFLHRLQAQGPDSSAVQSST